jgi:hypothetical protein
VDTRASTKKKDCNDRWRRRQTVYLSFLSITAGINSNHSNPTRAPTTPKEDHPKRERHSRWE